MNLNNNEVICVHGGLHNPPDGNRLDETRQRQGNTNIDGLIYIQNEINRLGLNTITYDKFINNNIYSVDQLKKAIDNDKIKVNDKKLLGVKYYNFFIESWADLIASRV